MKYLKVFEEFDFKFSKEEKIKSIKNLHGLPKELKEVGEYILTTLIVQ